MKKIPLKIAVFIAIFYVLSALIAFLLKDDANSYGRVLLHEMYESENIDILYCGSSHVSHGIVSKIANEKTGKNNFSTGTASQSIFGTYAILKQAAKIHKISTVFLEMEFAMATKTSSAQKSGFTEDYIVANGIKDPKIKFDLLTSISKPKYYLNHFLPIGKDKQLTLNPAKIAKKLQSIFSGEYFKYVYSEKGSEYAGGVQF